MSSLRHIHDPVLLSLKMKGIRLFNLTTALHVSDVTIAHLQEHKTTVSTASGIRRAVTCKAVVRLNKLCDFRILLELYTRILLRCTNP
jgi:hypothetical protein